MSDKPIIFKKSVVEGDPLVLIDFLEKYSKLSKSILKKVLNNGGKELMSIIKRSL